MAIFLEIDYCESVHTPQIAR